MKTKFVLAVSVLAWLVFGPSQIARAQGQQAPPTRVARLDYVEGSVSFEPNGSQDWVQAQLNRPLTTGDDLWADQDSRAEVHIGGTAFRMGNQTGISFLNLNDNAVQVQLAQGTLEVSLLHLGPDQAYEVDTPNLAFSLLRPGEYRVETDPNGSSTVVTVYSGQGTVTGGGQAFNITPEQSATFTGTTQLSENVQPAPAPDSFEDWARSRESRVEHVVAARYVSEDVTGYDDLDDYGAWHSDPDYGEYWVPSGVGPDWEPYRVGNWCWIAPWGWTWVDDEPWGFAPFHYGRWAIIGNSWGWVPGPVAVTPVYAPALVGFVGGGAFGVGIGFSFGEGVGWYPLGPRDIYIPPYQVTPQYVQAINICDTRVINRTTIVNVYQDYTVNHMTNVNYMYAADPRAVTVVNRSTFLSGRPVATSAVRVNAAELEHPRVMTTAALTPSRASVVGPVATARVRPPATLASRRMVTKLKPSPRAEPFGKPRPTRNPNLSTAVLERSGYSAHLQEIRASAAARAPVPAARKPEPNQPAAPRTTAHPAGPNRPAAPPNETRPGARPFTPPNQPKETPRTAPSRPSTSPNQPRPNEARPNHPLTPPSRPAARPHEERPPERQPARPKAKPGPEAKPRPESSARPPQAERRQPTEQPRHEARPGPEAKPRPAPHPEEHPKEAPPKEKHPKPQPQ
jgi:hypothetical protein